MRDLPKLMDGVDVVALLTPLGAWSPTPLQAENKAVMPIDHKNN